MGKRNEKGSGLGIVGYDTYEFVVADIERSRRFYSQMMDVPETARLDEREAAKRGEDAVIFSAGKAQCVCVTPRERDSAADRWLKRHPDGVRVVGFRVRDIESTRNDLARHYDNIHFMDQHLDLAPTFRWFAGRIKQCRC